MSRRNFSQSWQRKWKKKNKEFTATCKTLDTSRIPFIAPVFVQTTAFGSGPSLSKPLLADISVPKWSHSYDLPLYSRSTQAAGSEYWLWHSVYFISFVIVKLQWRISDCRVLACHSFQIKGAFRLPKMVVCTNTGAMEGIRDVSRVLHVAGKVWFSFPAYTTFS